MSEKDLKVGLEIDTEVRNIGDLNSLIDRVEKAGKNVDFLRLRSDVLAESWDELNPAEQAQRLRRLKEACLKTARGEEALAESTKKTGSQAKKAGKNIDELRKKTNRLDKANSALSGRLKTVAAGLAAYFSVKTVGGFFKSAISGAADLEEQLDKVQAISGATNNEMAKIAETAKSLGASTRYTATQAAEGFEILARAGLDANQQIKVIPSVLALAQGQTIGMAESAQFVGDAITIMGGSFNEAGRFADVLAKGASQASTTVPQLANAISYAGQYAKEAGFDIEGLVGVLDVLAQSGLRGERAGTALKNIFAQLQDPASKAARELEKLGIETNSLEGVISGLKATGDRGKAAINAFGIEAGPALRALLTGGTKALSDYTQGLKNAEGAAQDAANKMDDNLNGVIRGLASAWDSIKITLGEPILKPLQAQIKRLSSVIRNADVIAELKKLGDYFANVFGDMAKVVVNFVENFTLDDTTNKVNVFADNLVNKFDRVGAGFSLVYNVLATGFNTVESIIFATASAVTRAVGTIINAQAKILDFVPLMGDVANSMKEVAGGMGAVADEFGNRAAKAFDDAAASANRLQNNITTLTTATKESTEAARQKTATVNAEAEAVHRLKTKVKELQQQEAEYIAANKKGSAEYNIAVKNRINLQVELSQKTEEINRRETEIFNQKSTQLAELKKQEAAFNVQTAADAEAYEAVVSRRVALEKELVSIAGDKVLLAYEEVDATNELVAAKSRAAQGSSQATQETTQAIKANTQAAQENAQATQQTAQAAEAAGGASAALASMLNNTRQQFAEFPPALEEFNRSLDDNYLSVKEYIEMLGTAEQRAIKVRDRYIETTKQAAAATSELSEKINDGTLSMSDIEDAAKFAASAMDILDESELEQLNDSIDAARQKLQSLEEKAKETAAAIADRLADATGDANDKINRKFQREIESIRKQQAQANGVGSEHYSKAIADLEKLKQIELKKQREREQEAEKRKIEAEKKAAERQRKSDERQQPNSTSTPRQTADERARAYRNTTGGAAGGNTVVLQLGNEKINIDGVTDEVMRRINQQLRQYQKGRGR